MTFAATETSDRSGRPIGLYHFRWGNTAWFYTSADTQQVVDGETYLPVAISDDGLSNGNATQREFTVHCPADLPVVQLFRGTPPSESVHLIKRKIHAGDPDSEVQIEWVGKISNVGRNDDGEAEITCRNPGLRRAGLRLTWCRSCPYFVFDSGCGLNKAVYANPRNVTAVTGNVVTVDGAALNAAPYYDGGFIEWDADGLGTLERRPIETQSGTNGVQLFGRADGVTVGLAITLYPGCDNTPETCETKFNNTDNNEALWFMPGKSPFDGTQVF